MSVTKRVWIERDPDHQTIRDKVRADFDAYAADFVHRLASTKFHLGKNGKKRRSPWWPYAIGRALEDTRAEVVWINGGIFFRTSSERDRVSDLANRYMAMGYGMVRGGVKRKSREEYLASRFEASLRGRNTTVAAEKEKAKLAHTDCPECGYPMKVRVARTGVNAGARFMGCSLYPSCKGTKTLTEARRSESERL